MLPVVSIILFYSRINILSSREIVTSQKLSTIRKSHLLPSRRIFADNVMFLNLLNDWFDIQIIAHHVWKSLVFLNRKS